MDTKLSWNDAEQECQSFGGNLASIPNEATNNFLNNLREKRFRWIGGYDFNTGGEWKWSDGSPWSYTNWNKGYPMNTEGKDYLSMFADGDWGDFHDAQLRFICQYTPTDTATNTTTPTTTTKITTTTTATSSGKKL